MANLEVKNEEEAYVITTPRGLKFPEHPQHCQDVKAHHGRVTGVSSISKEQWERFADMYPEVKAWFSHFESTGTKRNYGSALLRFCKTQDITPKELGELWHNQDEVIKARQIVSSYIETLTNPSIIHFTIYALKSFYRWYTKGFQLPLDTKKGGIGYISIKQKRGAEKKRYAWGSLDDIRRKVHEIIGAAKDLQDKTALTFLFRTGCRDGVLQNLKMKHIKEYQEIDGVRELVLTITGDIDPKISHYDFPMLEDSKEYGYYTYLANDGLELFERFLKEYHSESKLEDYVFFKNCKGKRRSAIVGLRTRFRTVTRKCGFPYQEIWLHQLRSLFEQLGDSALPRNQIEFLAGHLLKGAEKHYKWQNKTDSGRLYLKIDFGLPRPEKDEEIERLRKQIEIMAKAKEETPKPKPQLTIPDRPFPSMEEIESRQTEANIPIQTVQTSPGPIPEPIKPKEIPELAPRRLVIDKRACPLKSDYVRISVDCEECKRQNMKQYADCYKMRALIKAGSINEERRVLFKFALNPETNRYELEKTDVV